MENKAVSRDDRLNAAFWVCLVFFGAAACWRLFLALEKQLALYAYVDYFIMLGCLVVGAMQKNRWHNRLPACGIVLVCILTQIVNGGWSVNIGGIFMSGQPMLTLRHMADLVYYIALLVTAVFLFLDRGRASCFSSLAALLASLVFIVTTCVLTAEYTGDFNIAWEWWVENGMLVPTYFAVTSLLALCLFFYQYAAFTAPMRKKRREKLDAANKNARKRDA